MAGTGPATRPFPTRRPCGGCLLAAVLAPWAAYNRSCQRGVPLEAEAWSPMRRVPGEESARSPTKSPASPAGPAGDQQVNRSGNGGQAQQPSGAASGAPPAVCEEEAISNSPLRCGLGLRRLGCLRLQQQAGTTALGEGGHQGNAGSGAVQGDLEVHGSIGAGAWPVSSSSSDRSGCRSSRWLMGECDLGQVRSSGDRPGTCRLPRPKLETIQSCSCD
ncbi:MAG: hypothetical protein RLZZ206_671 [Cyanobacteriota bacterium]